MAAISTLRVLPSSSPSLYQTRRFQYAGGMGATSTLRVVALASPARVRVRCLPFAGEVGAIPTLGVVAAASPALPRGCHLHLRPLYPDSSSRYTAAAPGLQARCLPPVQAEGTEEPPQSLTTPEMPGWEQVICDVSSVTAKRGFLHLLAVLLLSGVKSTEFKSFVEWAADKLKLPPMVTAAILLGATAITILFDIAVMGKDINEVCSYLFDAWNEGQEGWHLFIGLGNDSVIRVWSDTNMEGHF